MKTYPTGHPTILYTKQAQ